MITHYDLFAGIGGFSLALEEVFNDETIKHIFCEWESFPTAVLKEQWPDGEYWGDIADLVAHTRSAGLEETRTSESPERDRGDSEFTTNTEQSGLQRSKQPERKRLDGLSHRTGENEKPDWSIVTGGFPCQPFSHAGRRNGTKDDRYKWPEMFTVIKNVRPKWVVAENVRGLVTWNDGMVLEQVCTDLESEGYEVQPLIIPAVAVNAPHRRDRVWIIAYRDSERREVQETHVQVSERNYDAKPSNTASHSSPNTGRQRRSKRSGEILRPEIQTTISKNYDYPDWQRDWREVALATCHDSMDDGISREMDGVRISNAKWRNESLKSYGNAIVPQVAMQIFKAIRTAEDSLHTT